MKFMLVTFLLVFTLTSFGKSFSSKECFDSKYTDTVKTPGALFGAIEEKLTVKKDICLVQVVYKKGVEKTWKVDVCRSPVHFKLNSYGSENIWKKEKENCRTHPQTSYCEEQHALFTTIKDIGLIYAEGEKEIIDDTHGKVNCVYKLLKKYLFNKYIFSKYEPVPDFLNQKKNRLIRKVRAFEEKKQVEDAKVEPIKILPVTPDFSEDSSDDSPSF